MLLVSFTPSSFSKSGTASGVVVNTGLPCSKKSVHKDLLRLSLSACDIPQDAVSAVDFGWKFSQLLWFCARIQKAIEFGSVQ